MASLRRNPNAGYGDEQDNLFSPRTVPGAPGVGGTDPVQTNPGQSGPELPSPPPTTHVPDVPVVPPPAAATAPDAGLRNPGTYHTKLLEGDPSKFNDAHYATSPKYEFLNAGRSGKYNYDQMDQMIKDLQGGPNGSHWAGWQTDGHGNLDYKGDPSKLDPTWGGVKHVDAVGAYGSFNSGDDSHTGFRWGVEDPNAPAPTNSSSAPGTTPPATNATSPFSSYLNTLVPPDKQQDPLAMIKQLMDQLGRTRGQ